MTDTLQTILADTRAEVARRKAARPYANVAAGAAQAGPPRGFTRALIAHAAPGRPALIAEIKKASPSKGLIRADFDPPAHARAYAAGGAACLSVLTNTAAFQGADAHLLAARRACNLPVLRKDFLVDPWQVAESRALGADAVLVILAAVDDDLARALIAESARWGLDVLVEVHDGAEMARARALDVRLVGVNARDLRSFAVDLGTVEALAREAPQGAVLVAESGISTAADVARVSRAGAAAILVGESLMRKSDLESAAKALFGR